MKLTKKDLKDLMKECLREVLKEEGVLTESVKQTVSRPVRTPVVLNGKKQVVATSSKLSSINPALSEAVQELTGKFQGPNAAIMAEIFADTAMTTLQEQNTGHQSFDVDGMGSYTRDDSENPAVNDHSLKALAPGGDVNRWAKIALAASKK